MQRNERRKIAQKNMIFFLKIPPFFSKKRHIFGLFQKNR